MSSHTSNTTFHPPPPQAQPPPSVGLPLVGALPFLLRRPFDFLKRARQDSGDIYTLDLGATHLIALNHPRHAQHVLRDKAPLYTKGGPLWDTARVLIGNGLPVSEGDFWRRQRRLVQPHFHRQRLAAMASLMAEAIDDNLARWREAAASGQPLDVFPLLSRLTMDVVVRTLFGASLTSREADTISQEMGYVLNHILRGMLTHALPEWVPVPGQRRFQEAIRLIDDVVLRAVEHCRRGGEDASLIGMLADTVDADTGERMTHQQLRDEAVSFFLAGYETTSAGLAFALGCVAERPALAQALHQEATTVLHGERPGFAHAPRLTLARNVFMEALRRYPPTYWLPRTALEDDSIDGFHIPAGTQVGVMTYAIHHHPDFWEQPEHFDPERFSPERALSRHPLAWMPFGAGQGMCVGKEFALMEAQFALARVLERFEVEPAADFHLELELATTLRPRGGVWLHLRPRTAERQPPALPRAA